MIRAPRFVGLNHDPRAGLNGSSIRRRHLCLGRRFWGKPDINRLIKPAESVANAQADFEFFSIDNPRLIAPQPGKCYFSLLSRRYQDSFASPHERSSRLVAQE
jgi:hypothetical protein